MICSECDTKETSRWTASNADPNKPVCKACYQRQVRRAFRSLASIVCILSALPVFVTDASVMYLHSSVPPAGTAPNAGSPVRTRARCARRGSRTARGCARSAGQRGSRRPRLRLVREGRGHCEVWLPSKLIEGAALALVLVLQTRGSLDRAWRLVREGRDTVKSWHKSKRIEGAPWLCKSCFEREVRTSLSFPLLSRERERATSSATVRFSAHRAPFALPVLRRKRKS